MTTIWSMTWKELLRKKVLLLTVILTVLFLITFWFIASTLGNSYSGSNRGLPSSDPGLLITKFSEGMVILGLGFFFASFVLAFLAIFSSSSVISGEAEQGIMQALMPRPIARWKWYLGRWLGYVSFCMVYALALFSAILIITNIHATIPKEATNIVIAYFLFASVVPLLISLSMLGSSFFSAIGNGVFMTMLYGGGWLGGMIDKVASQFASLKHEMGSSLDTISGLLSLAMPADGLQRTMLDRLFNYSSLQELISSSNNDFFVIFGIGSAPSPAFLWYALVYTLVALALGLWRFQRKDL
ncbi:ABC-type transport system involved in multi-copper enzyme maturation permease subunit [Paenibacillus shirakamiensis]|uniref:ABC-type transport system involved in multi-copper enzyme maturation permease subunit n=1 Tax=Paenibacillus shirakamiensis TaxID=1265935 RepID=A0ABS4JGX9_9BACL|nr:ABC transporter permease [Paenibacillus shirakamiensis]MBP2000974.1 ABC-type transport system involved in multi-copper enzyme maturation permease subunit [Paenibacillus shirakamiensis]